MTVTTAALVVGRRHVGPQDRELVDLLFAESRPELAALPAQTRGPLLDMQQRAQTSHIEASYPEARHEIIVADGIGVGRIILAVGASQTRVVDIIVAQSHRRRGIASTVLREVLAEAEHRGHPVTLTVWPDNVGALALYESHGFVVVPDGGVHLAMRWEPSERRNNT